MGSDSSLGSETAVRICGEGDALAWDRFVAGQPSATGYHEWGWRAVLAGTFNHEAIYLAAWHAHDIVGVLPLIRIHSRLFGDSLTSLPFVNYGGVLAASDRVAQELLAAAAAIAADRRCAHVELRHVERRFADAPFKHHKVAMRLPLQPDMWERLDRKVRNQIRKGQKSSLIVEEGGAELLDAFYGVFARNMRDLGTPVYSRRFFARVLDAFPDRTAIHVVRLGSQPVAAGITFRTGTTVEVPWASSVRDFNILCPNHVLYWGVIESAVKRGCQVLDFGRSTPNEGTYRFKEQWGAAPLPLHWEYWLRSGTALPNTSPSNPKFRWAMRMWQQLPLPVASAIGPRIVRAIP
jgi:serine/alanine adding enzyme